MTTFFSSSPTKLHLAIYITLEIILLTLLFNLLSERLVIYLHQQDKEAWIASQEKPYREDIYGGKTPEETWNLFLTALEKEDIEEASRYFAVDVRQKEKIALKEIIDKNILETALKNFSTFTIESGIQGSSAYYHIKMPFKESKNGFIYSPVVFHFNEFTHVWKISVL